MVSLKEVKESLCALKRESAMRCASLSTSKASYSPQEEYIDSEIMNTTANEILFFINDDVFSFEYKILT